MTSRRRSGFTILEILLALAIGVVLMSALYFGITLQMRSAQAGRQLTQQNTLSRSLFTRMDNDLNATISLTDPTRWRNQAISATISSLTATSNTNSNGVWTSSTIVLPLGGFATCDNQHLTLYVGRFPREAFQDTSSSSSGSNSGNNNNNNANNTNGVGASDVRCISYWFVEGKGLMRQEFGQATSDDAQNPAYPEDDTNVIAPEVTNVQFSYFDGMNWQTSWTGTLLPLGTQQQQGADLINPLGPPRAIKIMLEFRLPRDEFAADPKADRKTKQYSHVILIHSADGPTPLNSNNMSITQTSGGGDMP